MFTGRVNPEELHVAPRSGFSPALALGRGPDLVPAKTLSEPAHRFQLLLVLPKRVFSHHDKSGGVASVVMITMLRIDA